MFTVPLTIFVGSRARNTNARWVFSRRATTSELISLKDGPIWSSLKIVWYFKGPLPVDCGCGCTHPPLQGMDDNGDFVSFHAHTLDIPFWDACCSLSLHSGQALPLRDGAENSQCVPDALGRVGITPYSSVSLASSVDSWRSQFEAWQAGTLERSELAMFSTSSLT